MESPLKVNNSSSNNNNIIIKDNSNTMCRVYLFIWTTILFIVSAVVVVNAGASAFSGAALRGELSHTKTLTRRTPPVRKPVAKPLYPVTRTIYVLGPESSGTRFVSRSIGQALDPTTRWNGEFPPCKTFDDHNTKESYHIQHISLPWGGVCKDKIEILQNVNLCGIAPKQPRWFVDIKSLLNAHPKDYAVVLTRDPNFALRSVLKKHCFKQEMAIKERDTAIRLINEALSEPSISDRLVHVEYETLGTLPEVTWNKVFKVLKIQPVSAFKTPFFKSGNHFRRALQFSPNFDEYDEDGDLDGWGNSTLIGSEEEEDNSDDFQDGDEQEA